jgi:hypothetical protein
MFALISVTHIVSSAHLKLLLSSSTFLKILLDTCNLHGASGSYKEQKNEAEEVILNEADER